VIIRPKECGNSEYSKMLN